MFPKLNPMYHSRVKKIFGPPGTGKTTFLLNIVEEFTQTEKNNPPDTKGTIPTKSMTDWTQMSSEERRRNWGTILESYMKR